MATTGYLSGTCGPATRAVRKILISVRLVLPDESACEKNDRVGLLLREARLRLLPLICIGDSQMPGVIRALAVRQYVLVIALTIGFAAIPFVELFGVVWLSMQLLHAMSPDAMDFSQPANYLAAAIALGGLEFFGKICALCLALTILSQPIRAMRS